MTGYKGGVTMKALRMEHSPMQWADIERRSEDAGGRKAMCLLICLWSVIINYPTYIQHMMGWFKPWGDIAYLNISA
jgi:hypothetical protein